MPRPMKAAGFPATADNLAHEFLRRCGQIQWSHTQAQGCFEKEVARSHCHLLMSCAHDHKEFFCEDLARLVTVGVLPNIANSGHAAFDTTTNLLAGVGLRPPNPSTSPDELESQFDTMAKPKAPTPPLAHFLSANWI